MGNWLLEPTSPHTDPRWIPNDSIRTTYDFLTTSIITLFVCVWTALHPNIPMSTERKSSTVLFINKMANAMMAMLAPEIMLDIAFMQLWEARLICNKLHKIELQGEKEAGIVWDKESKRGYGDGQQQDEIFQVEAVAASAATGLAEGKSATVTTQDGTPSEVGPVQSRWRRTYTYLFPHYLELGFFLAMGGIEVVDKANPTARRQLTPQGVIKMARARLLPKLNIDEINDKSKSDGFARLVVCIQAGWMALQAIVRKINGLPLTLLEIHILTNVACAWGMYLIWLKKPQNVLVPTIAEIDAEGIALLIDKPKDFAKGVSPNLWTANGDIFSGLSNEGSLINDTETVFLDLSREDLIQIIFNLPIRGIYGAIHLLPWNAHFPTHLERIMWRTSAVVIFAGPTIGLFLSIVIYPLMRPLLSANGIMVHEGENISLKRRPTMQEMSGSAKSGRWMRLALQVYVWVYHWVVRPVVCWGQALARLFFFVESFASLRSLPVGTYQSVSWLGMIPHF